MGLTGAGHALRLPLWEPSTVLRWLGEGIHLRLAPELVEIRVGSRSSEVDLHIDRPVISPHHATLVRIDESLQVLDGGTGQTFEYDARTEAYAPRAHFLVNVGDHFALGTVRLMPLEERLAALVPALEQHCGPRAHLRVDEALVAIVRARPLCIEAVPSWSPELLSTIHRSSPRRGHRFAMLDPIPESPEAIDAVCTSSAGGMIVIDLRGRAGVPESLVDALRSRRYHLWPCFLVAPGAPHHSIVAELNPHWL